MMVWGELDRLDRLLGGRKKTRDGRGTERLGRNDRE
jgi:hypothetical protein